MLALQTIINLLLGPIVIILVTVGIGFAITIPVVLMYTYMSIKKKVVKEIDEKFVVNDRELLMKKSRQIGFISLIISTSLFLLIYFFMGLFFNFFRVSSNGDFYTNDFTPMIFAGICILGNGFLGFFIARILIDREIKKYLLNYQNNTGEIKN